MKRNGIILITTMAAFLLAGQAIGAGFPITAASPQATGGEIDGSSPFTIDVYMNNDTGEDVVGFGISFGFSSPDGSIENITHVDVDGDVEMPSVEYINSFDDYMPLSTHVDGAIYMDGTLPDYVNFTPIGITGIPQGLGSEAYIRFNIQVDYSTTGTTGEFCIDSIGSAQSGGVEDWDWMFSAPYMPASFNGSYCWTITNLVHTDVKQIGSENDVLPQSFRLEQNYPNPFNPNTTFNFALPKQSQVRIDIFNVLGQKIKTLADTEYPAGRYSVDWNGINDNGSAAASGIYFYRMSADNFQDTKKLMLLK